MKITDQDVPTDLRALYDSLVSQLIKTETDPTRVRTRKAAKLAHAGRARRNVTKADVYRRTVRALLRTRGLDPLDEANAEEMAITLDILLDASVAVDGLAPLDKLQSAWLSGHPTITHDPDPPPYAYPDATNLPTISTWGTGAPAAASLRYFGQKYAGYFEDDTWRWHDFVSELAFPYVDPEHTPLVLALDFTITASADKRGSRPMFSFVWQIDFYDTEPDISTDRHPPTTKIMSSYFRYQPPTGSAPYYHATLQRKLVLVPTNLKDAAGKKFVRVRVALRPMKGHANNNNTTVTTTATGTATLYGEEAAATEYLSCAFASGASEITYLSADATTATTWDISPAVNPTIANGTQCLCESGAGIPSVMIQGDATPHQIEYFAEIRPVGAMRDKIFFIVIGDNSNPVYWDPTHYFSVDGSGTLIYEGGYNENWFAPPETRVLQQYKPSAYVLWAITEAGDIIDPNFEQRFVTTITKSAQKTLQWDGSIYQQDDEGQWWKFSPPTFDPQGLFTWDTPSYLAPDVKIGRPQKKNGGAFPTLWGIVRDTGETGARQYHLLAWNGSEHYIDLPPGNYTNFIGTVP